MPAWRTPGSAPTSSRISSRQASPPTASNHKKESQMNMPVDTLADPIAAHAKEMLAHLGEDPRRAGLRDTPQRFANALRFLTGGYEAEPRDVVGNGVFDAEGEGVVLVRDIEFHSLCEHHLLPFLGRVHEIGRASCRERVES